MATGAVVGLVDCMLSMWEALGWNTSIEKAQIVYFIPDLNGNTPIFKFPGRF